MVTGRLTPFNGVLIGRYGRSLYVPALVAGVKAAGAGEKHENLSAGGADRYAFDRDSLHFSARAAVQNSSQ